MPASETRERKAAEAPEALLGRLEEAVGRLLTEFSTLQERAEEAESAHRKLSDALQQSEFDPLDGRDVEERVQRLAAENRRLREVIEQARERAERIRSRLIVVEDEL